jgi:hypothetical protein
VTNFRHSRRQETLLKARFQGELNGPEESTALDQGSRDAARAVYDCLTAGRGGAHRWLFWRPKVSLLSSLRDIGTVPSVAVIAFGGCLGGLLNYMQFNAPGAFERNNPLFQAVAFGIAAAIPATHTKARTPMACATGCAVCIWKSQFIGLAKPPQTRKL